MSITTSSLSGNHSFERSPGSELAYASVNDVTLEKIGEGEVSATIKLGSSKSKAGVGFRADNGTFIYALADADTNTLRIERRVQGYSILDTRVTPYEYQITDWADRDPPSIFDLKDWTDEIDDNWHVWTMDYEPINLTSSTAYKITLSFSRRSMAVMAVLESDDGYIYLELRDHDPHDGETMWRSTDFINWKHIADIPRPPDDHPGKGWKMGALLDTHTSPLYSPSNPEAVEVLFDGTYYRYLAFTERGRFMVTNDLSDPSADNWKYHKLYADYNTKPRTEWTPLKYDKMCAGDAFFNIDGNIILTVQATPDFNVGGQPECTNLEIIVDGNEPWKVLHTSRLPYLQGYYGRAVTGVLDEYTAWDGSTFPGNTIQKDGWLWQYNGANNTFVSLVKAYNRHLFEYRNLTLSDFTPASAQDVTVSVIARNVGNIAGTSDVELKINGIVTDTQSVTLEKNEETTIEFSVSKTSGTHTIGVGTATATMVVDGGQEGHYFANGMKIGEVDQDSAII